MLATQKCEIYKRHRLETTLLYQLVEVHYPDVLFNPINFIGKLAALIPPPRLNLTRFFSVFAPNSNLRARVTASQRGKNSPKLENRQSDKPCHARIMSWAQRLKRVFNIDMTECEKCQQHNVTIIACIIEPAIIHKILSYLDKQGSSITGNNTTAPPVVALEQRVMFDDFTIQRDFDFGA